MNRNRELANQKGIVIMEERAKKIIDACMQEKNKNPIGIFLNIVRKDFVRMHGPEHHILDGAALLTAFYNAGCRYFNGMQCELSFCRQII